jgi:hypothetical protein
LLDGIQELFHGLWLALEVWQSHHHSGASSGRPTSLVAGGLLGGNIGLQRAVPRSPFLMGKSLMWYEDEGALEWSLITEQQRVFTDEEAIRATHENMAHPVFADPKNAEVISLIKLNTHRQPLYCLSEETHDFTSFSILYCRMAGAPVAFRYSGNPLFEKDAEEILSAME